MSDLLDLDLAGLRAAIASGDASPDDALEQARARAEATAGLNAWVELVEDPDRDAAPEGPLAGVPVAIKDMFVDRGRQPTVGSRVHARGLQGTATVIERLRGAGARVVGYTNLHEWGLGMTSKHTATGPIRNPWDPATAPGGSSGGSASAVASGAVPAAIGTDAGGSVRCPAAMCRLVGLKPTWGAVPMTGFCEGDGPIDHIGPLTRTVADARTVFEVMSATRCGDVDLSGLRIGIAGGYLMSDARPRVAAAVERAVALLRPRVAGVRTVDLDVCKVAGWAVPFLLLPWTYGFLSDAVRDRPGDLCPETLAVLRMGAVIGEGAGCSHDHTALIDFLRRTTPPRRQLDLPDLPPVVRRPLQRHLYNLRQGELAQLKVKEAFASAFRDADVVVTPTVPAGPVRIDGTPSGSDDKERGADSTYLPFTGPMNLAGLPALAVPCGDAGEWTASVTFTAPAGRDDVVLAIGEALEDALGGRYANRVAPR